MARVPEISPTVFGMEIEYGSWAYDCGEPAQMEIVSRAFWMEILAVLDRPEPTSKNTSRWLRNGDRLYIDVGPHLEHAAREEQEVIRAVASHFGADYGIGDAVTTILSQDEKTIRRMLEAGRVSKDRRDQVMARIAEGKDVFRLYRNNADGKGKSWGAHQNYLTARRVQLSDIIRAMTPLRVALHVVTGAGHMAFDRHVADGEFMTISQRARHTKYIASSKTGEGGRGIFNTRDEPHGEDTLYRRVHLIDGDANVSHLANYLAVGLTNLVLKAVEVGMVPDTLSFPFFDYDHSNYGNPLHPVEQLYSIDADPTLQTDLVLDNDRRISPIDVLYEYVEIATDFVTKYAETPENRNIIAKWNWVLEGLVEYRDFGRITQLDGAVDWINKRAMSFRAIDKWNVRPSQLRYDRRSTKHLAVAMDRLAAFDLRYHLTTNPVHGVNALFTPEQLRAAFATPSPVGRARLRALAAATDGATVTDWGKVSVKAARGVDIPLRFDAPAFPDADTLQRAEALYPDDALARIIHLGSASKEHVNSMTGREGTLLGRSQPSLS